MALILWHYMTDLIPTGGQYAPGGFVRPLMRSWGTGGPLVLDHVGTLIAVCPRASVNGAALVMWPDGVSAREVPPDIGQEYVQQKLEEGSIYDEALQDTLDRGVWRSDP